jgi:N-acetylmuramoyl-L-alanine amidase
VKRVVVVLAACLLALSVHIPLTYGLTFKDVGDSHRAKKEIYYLAEGKIINGDSKGYFQPDRAVTRAEATAMIGRVLSLDGTQKETEFKDVGINNFASGYIQAAANLNIVTGYSDGSFKPEQPVSRGEMALLLSRAFQWNAETIRAATKLLIDKGIAQGFADGSFGELQSIKRSDFAVFLARAVNEQLRLPGEEVSFDTTFYVHATGLNLRTGPSTNFPVILTIPMSKPVQVGYYIGKWAYIEVDKTRGFVHTDFLKDTSISTDELYQRTIIIDPGHGGSDPGAIGFGLYEKDVVLDVALRMKDYFKQTPFQVKYTRETDKRVALSDRVAFAKEQNGDIFVSIHANAFNGSANGTETYYYSAAATNPHVEASKALATYIQKRMVDAWQLADRGVKKGNFHVLRENTMPAALVELGFIDNKKDNEKLKSPEMRQIAAKAIYLGILDYYYHYEKLDVQILYDILKEEPSPKLH